MSHYYQFDEKIISNEKEIEFNIENTIIKLFTDHGVFSYNELDYGTELLLKTIIKYNDFNNKKVIDLGCGYGPIGLYLQKHFHKNINMTMADINPRAIELTKKNALINDLSVNILVSDFFEKVDQHSFDFIISNPPIRIGKQNLFKTYKDSFDRLVDNGSLWIVVRKQQGALSHVEFLKTIYKEVNIINRSKGYFIIQAIK